jgi:hypothetical protein
MIHVVQIGPCLASFLDPIPCCDPYKDQQWLTPSIYHSPQVLYSSIPGSMWSTTQTVQSKSWIIIDYSADSLLICSHCCRSYCSFGSPVGISKWYTRLKSYSIQMANCNSIIQSRAHSELNEGTSMKPCPCRGSLIFSCCMRKEGEPG